MPFPEYTLNNGLKIPGIGFGTWKIPQPTTAQNVETAIEVGFNHIDTAQIYGNEEQVGQALKESGLKREDIWVTTKWSGRPWGDGQSIDPHTSVKQSLEKLNLKSLDLYLVHTPRLFAGKIAAGWKEIEALQRKGYTKSIGVSNFTLDDMKTLLEGQSKTAASEDCYRDDVDAEDEEVDEKMGGDVEDEKHKKHKKKHHHKGKREAFIKPVINQIELHPYVWAQYKENVEYCQANDVVVEAYSPLKPLTTYPGGPLDAVLIKIGGKYTAPPEQILLAWIKAKGCVALTTSTRKDRLETYIAAGDLDLLPEEVAELDEAGARGPGTAKKIIKRVVMGTLLQVGIYLGIKHGLSGFMGC